MAKNEKNIYQRIAEVTTAIKAFEKDGTNTRFNFKFAGIEKVIQAIQPICIENGITLIQSAKMLEPVTSEGKDISRCEAILTAVNMDNPDDRHTITMPGYGYDTLDKGIFKAIAGARKYGIFGLFNLSAGDDEPDADNSNPAPQRRNAPVPASKPRQRTSTPKAQTSTSETAQRIQDTLFSEVEPGFPPQKYNEKSQKSFDVKLIGIAMASNEKMGWAFRDARAKDKGALVGVADKLGYEGEEQRYKLFTAIYIAFRVDKKDRVISTKEMQARHTAFLFDAMEHINNKAPDDPYPWSAYDPDSSQHAAEEPDATDKAHEYVDLEEEDDEFLID